jgi:hypothetical protein
VVFDHNLLFCKIRFCSRIRKFSVALPEPERYARTEVEEERWPSLRDTAQRGTWRCSDKGPAVKFAYSIGEHDAESSKGRLSGRRVWNKVSSGDEIDPQGDAADR